MKLISEKVKERTGAARLAEEFTQVHNSLALDERQKLSTATVLGVAAQGEFLTGTLASIDVVDQGLKASLAGSGAFENAALKTSVVSSLQEVGNPGRLLRDQLNSLDLHSTSRQIQDMLAGFQIDSNAVGLVSPVDRYVDTLRDLQKQFAGIVDESLFNSFNKNIQESTFVSFAALRDGIIGPLSGLMIVDPLERHGMFTWEGADKSNPAFDSAVFFAASPTLQPLSPTSRKLLIECHISCSICREPMIVEGEEQYWESSGKLRIFIRRLSDLLNLCEKSKRIARLLGHPPCAPHRKNPPGTSPHPGKR